MNILHVIQRYYPYIGGSELYFQELSERFAREGNHITLYTTDAWDLEHFWSSGKRSISIRQEVHNGVEIHRFAVERLPAAPLTYPALRRAMTEVARLPLNTTPFLFSLSRWTPHVPALERALEKLDEPFDIVHAANIPLDSIIYAAFRFAQCRKIPFVVTPFTHLGEPNDRRIRKYYTMPHQIAMLRDAHAVIVQTQLEVNELARLGVPRGKMQCIGVGVNPDQVLGGDGLRARAKYGIEGTIVLFLGTAAYDKGTMHLIQAMEQLWMHRDATLVIAGPQLTQFQKFFAGRSQETKKRTRVLGFVSDEDKRDLLAACDVFVLPSRTDSFGIVYLEAWLYNKPVIGARAGGVPAVIDDEHDGFLVNFGDIEMLETRIEQLLKDRALADSFGNIGHAKVLRELTWDKKYAQVKALYESLLK